MKIIQVDFFNLQINPVAGTNDSAQLVQSTGLSLFGKDVA